MGHLLRKIKLEKLKTKPSLDRGFNLCTSLKGHDEDELTDAVLERRVVRGDVMNVTYNGCDAGFIYLGICPTTHGMLDGERHYLYDIAEEEVVIPQRIDSWKVVGHAEDLENSTIIPKDAYVPPFVL